VLSYTNRATDVTERSFVRVDVTEVIPLLVIELSPHTNGKCGRKSRRCHFLVVLHGSHHWERWRWTSHTSGIVVRKEIEMTLPGFIDSVSPRNGEFSRTTRVWFTSSRKERFTPAAGYVGCCGDFDCNAMFSNPCVVDGRCYWVPELRQYCCYAWNRCN
jgi:hypothetical protein